MDRQADVTYRAKMAGAANRIDAKSRTISQQFVPPIARLVKHNKIGFGKIPSP